MSLSLQTLKRKPLILIYIAGIVLLVLAAYLWWGVLNVRPERVFWGMIEQGLTTTGVTVQAAQSNQGTDVRQMIQFSYGADNRSHSLTTLHQGNTTVVDEMISTPTADYTRYVSVKTDQKTKAGKPLDFSKIAGVWAKREGSAQLFSQDVLGTGLPLGGVATPIAHLNSELRAKMIKQIRDQGVYTVNFKDIKKQSQDGRMVYVYTAKVQPVPYANMMKTLAKNIGLHDLDSLDPNNFASQKPFEIRMTVDARSQQLLTAEGVGADIKQTYSGYDLPVAIDLPAKTITGTELQKRLSELQQ